MHPTKARRKENNLLGPVEGRLKALHLLWRSVLVVFVLTVSTPAALMDSAYAAGQSSSHAGKHHAIRPHATKIRVVKQRKKLRSALTPPAPTDFGPHFDFPPASLNNGPTQAPYPGW